MTCISGPCAVVGDVTSNIARRFGGSKQTLVCPGAHEYCLYWRVDNDRDTAEHRRRGVDFDTISLR